MRLHLFKRIDQVRTYYFNAGILTVLGCFKLNDPSPTAIAEQFKVSAITAEPGFVLGPPFGTVTDVAAFYQQLTGTTCLSDITLSLNADGSSAINNPATCRNAGDAGSFAGFSGARWGVNGGTLTLTAPNGTTTDYGVIRDGNNLRLTRQQPIPGSSSSSTVTTVLRRL
ncbi:hypothetical protein J2I47_07320 [Fibrella sp. HMF5335]|uniref:Lipocalin-like domain-containing protein n=1 Tax=Fibrella rubiginis TaxID=2817060 RepID=A0A939K2I5_9BACT|nr:hypothetical protein [Fibrella rubiginis]MBO0936354.1 hypothetical protein [Fibrella rubiginis]